MKTKIIITRQGFLFNTKISRSVPSQWSDEVSCPITQERAREIISFHPDGRFENGVNFGTGSWTWQVEVEEEAVPT